MMDKFTTQFQSILGAAQTLAINHDNQFIDPVHILSALVTEQSHLLQLAQVNVPLLSQSLAEKVSSLPKVSGGRVMCSCHKRRQLY
jgi:ATP-dependent Clp protease ATP-binding subunit ClpB